MRTKTLNDTYFAHILLIERKEIIQNREITYSLPEDPHHIGKIMVRIGQQDLHLTRLIDGSYTTHFLPFRNYSSVKDITNDIIDKVPAFNKEFQV